MNWIEFKSIIDKWEMFYRNKSLTLILKDKSIDYSELENLYFSVFKKKVNVGCDQCHLDALTELRNINQKTLKDMNELRYKLVENKRFMINGRAWMSHSVDFNNEVAEEILKVYGKSAFAEIKDAPKVEEIITEAPILETEKPILEKQVKKEVPKVVQKKKVVKIVKKRR